MWNESTGLKQGENRSDRDVLKEIAVQVFDQNNLQFYIEIGKEWSVQKDWGMYLCT